LRAVPDFIPWRSLAPNGVTVSFLSATAADELDRLVKWQGSLGPQLEMDEHPVGASLGLQPPCIAAPSSLIRPCSIAQGVKT